jgi:hypothetical protein
MAVVIRVYEDGFDDIKENNRIHIPHKPGAPVSR